MLLGMGVDLGPGNIVLDADPAPPPERGTAAASFRPMSIVVKRSPISATAVHLLTNTEIHSAHTTSAGKLFQTLTTYLARNVVYS